MPSDQSIQRAAEALARPRATFRSAVVEAVEEVRAFLEQRESSDAWASARATRDLGDFGAERIDAERFASLFTPAEGLDPLLRSRVERALATLEIAVGESEQLFHLRVPTGSQLSAEVGWALAEIGRVFAAAQLVELVRSGRFRPEMHDSLLGAFPFHRWNRAERQIAPPLVVEVDGADLRAGGLADFLDGAQRLVLVVHGEAPPAALARLITPGVFVAQIGEAGDLERLARGAGPAVIAVMPQGSARFVHDPGGGEALRDRLRVEHLPAPGENGSSLAGWSGFQMAEDLRHLAMLREMAEAVPVLPADAPQGAEPPAAAEPEGLLAAWLLRQAGLQDEQPAVVTNATPPTDERPLRPT